MIDDALCHHLRNLKMGGYFFTLVTQMKGEQGLCRVVVDVADQSFESNSSFDLSCDKFGGYEKNKISNYFWKRSKFDFWSVMS